MPVCRDMRIIIMVFPPPYSGIDTEVMKPWDFPPQNLVPPTPPKKAEFLLKKEGKEKFNFPVMKGPSTATHMSLSREALTAIHSIHY